MSDHESDMTEFSRKTKRELARLADGSLSEQQRRSAQARVDTSPELQAALADQQGAIELLRAGDEVHAPRALHERLEEMIAGAKDTSRTDMSRAGAATGPRRQARPAPRRPLPRVGAAAALAAVVAIVVAALTSLGGSQPLTVQRAAALTLEPATMPAPAESSSRHAQLAVSVDGVAFPYWHERFGWRSDGVRHDRLAGHSVTTVFYTDSGGQRVGYAIASGSAPSQSGGTAVRRWGVTYHLSHHAGANLIAWQRDGHLCVIAGRGVSAHTLLRLASWSSNSSHSA